MFFVLIISSMLFIGLITAALLFIREIQNTQAKEEFIDEEVDGEILLNNNLTGELEDLPPE